MSRRQLPCYLRFDRSCCCVLSRVRCEVAVPASKQPRAISDRGPHHTVACAHSDPTALPHTSDRGAPLHLRLLQTSSILVLSLALSASSTVSPPSTYTTRYLSFPRISHAYITSPPPIPFHNLPILYTSYQPPADVLQTKLGAAGVVGRATACCGSGGWLPREVPVRIQRVEAKPSSIRVS